MVGVYSPGNGGNGGNGTLKPEDFKQETFTYVDNNTFALAQAATKVLHIYIDNGVYPGEVPAGAATEITVDPALVLPGNKITVVYLTA